MERRSLPPWDPRASTRLVARAAMSVVRGRFQGDALHAGSRLEVALASHVMRVAAMEVAHLEFAAMRAAIEEFIPPAPATIYTRIRAARELGVRAAWLEPRRGATPRTILYLHGGGYVFGSLRTHADLCARVAVAAGARVLFLDYRLAPEHPFPAAFDDALAAYRALLAHGVDPRTLALAGDSAGGALAVTLAAHLREEGLPLPAALGLLSPWVEPGTEGRDVDPDAHRDWLPVHAFGRAAAAYAGDVPLHDPRVAPVHADLRGLPPTLVHFGSDEVLASQIRRFVARAEAARVPLEVDEATGMIHVWHLLAPVVLESREAITRLGAFVRRHVAPV